MRILSFDIEEWFHLLDHGATRGEADWARFPRRLDENIEPIFELLRRHGCGATFFCLGWVAREYPHVVRRIRDAGHEVATHSDLHQLAYTQSPGEFRDDLARSIDCLEDVTGKKVVSYRAPGFSFKQDNAWVFDVLLDLGIERDCSIFPAPRAHGGFASYGAAEPNRLQVGERRLKEFPINLADVLGRKVIFSGGGYFRLLPRRVIANLVERSGYVMTYFHPRDFDADQPMVPGLSAARRFKSYYGLAGTFDKLDWILGRYAFTSLAAADAAIDWASRPVVALDA